MSQLDTYLESLVPYVAQQIGVPNLTIDLVKRVIRQESGGNQGAKSKAGAIGLMQLMPATAAELGVNPNDPQQNLYGGVLYLAQQMKRFNGDPALGLAAYNAGAGNVQKYGGIPPFAETQNYVKSILGSSGDSNSSFNNTDMQETNNQTNIQEIVKQKIAQGIEISEEELSALKENKINKIKEKLQNDIEISPEELSFVKEYKGIKDTPQDKLEQKKTAINEQKVIDDLNKLAPVLDVKLNAQGETVRERYLKKVYGEENVTIAPETNEFYINRGGNFQTPAPKPTFVGQLGAMGGDVVAGAVGEGIGGSVFGVPGAVVGAGLGAAAGTGVNFTKATAAAAAQGLVKPEELKEIAKSGGFASATSGVLGTVFGGLGQALKPLGKAATLAGNTGDEIAKYKNAFLRQAKSDELLGQVQGASDLGTLAKDTMTQTFNSIKASTDQAFQAADQAFGESLQKGTFTFVDASKAVSQLQSKLAGFVDDGLIPEAEAKVAFDAITKQLNNVKRNVLGGGLQASDLAKSRFMQTVEKLPENGRMAFNMQDIGNNLGFDPKQVTALDLRKTSNVIQDLFKNTKNTRLQKVLASFRSGVDGALGAVKGGLDDSEEMLKEAFIRSGGDIESFVSQGAEALGSPKIASDFLNSIVTPKGAKDFVNYKQAFNIAKQKYTLFPEKFRNLIYKGASEKDFAESLLKAKVEEIAPLQSLFRSVGKEKDFIQSLKGEILNQETSRRNAFRQFRPATPTAIRQAEARTIREVKALQGSGVKPNFDTVKAMELKPSEKLSETEPILIGQNIGKFFNKNRGAYRLLGADAKQFARTAKDLETATIGSGVTTNLQASNQFASDKLAEAGGGFIKKALQGLGPAGAAISDVASGFINPLQRTAGNVLESAAPVFGSGILPSIVRPAAGNLLGSLAGINPATNFSNTALTEEQQRRLIGGVRNGQR
jgi:hypothetical protein